MTVYSVRFISGGTTRVRSRSEAMQEAYFDHFRDGYVYTKKGKRKVRQTDRGRLYLGGWENP